MFSKSNLERRKTRYVSHKIQGRFVFRLITYWFLYHAFLLHALFLSNGLLVDDVPQSFGTRYRAFLGDHVMLIVCAIAVFPIIAWDMIKLTHRVVGPLVQLGHGLTDMSNGRRTPPIELRKGDLLTEFASSFNEFIAFHNARLSDGAEHALSGSVETEEASLMT